VFGKKGVRRCVHYLILGGTPWLWTKKIWNPPGRQRTVACKPVSDPQPPKEPPRIGSAKVEGTGGKSDRKRSEVDERGNQEFLGGELRPNAFQVIECSERNPIVERHEQHNERLKCEQHEVMGCMRPRIIRHSCLSYSVPVYSCQTLEPTNSPWLIGVTPPCSRRSGSAVRGGLCDFRFMARMGGLGRSGWCCRQF
jgi:hypothetical protein